MTNILCRKKSDDVDMGYLGKIMTNVQKRLKPASFRADILYDEYIDHAEKKAQNSAMIFIFNYRDRKLWDVRIILGEQSLQ